MAQGAIDHVKAVQRHRDGEWILEVHGTFAAPGGATIRAEAMHDGINPSIALFEVHAEGGAGGATPQPFAIERGIEHGQYTQVNINPAKDGSVTVSVVDEKSLS